MKMKKIHIASTFMLVTLLSGCQTNQDLLMGYAVNQMCSRHFIAGEPIEFIKDNVINESLFVLGNPTFIKNENLPNGVKSVTVRKGDNNQRTAVYRPGLGCTLAMKESAYSAENIAQNTIEPYTGITQEDFPVVSIPRVSQKYLQTTFFKEDSTLSSKKYNTFGVVIAQNGEVIAESYDGFHNSNTPMLSWSMAKTITGMLTSLVIKNDNGVTTEETEILPATQSFSATSLKNILNMSSGLQWVEDNTADMNNDLEPMWYQNGNSVAFAKSKSKVYEPGSKFEYSTGTAQILSGYLGERMGGDVQSIHNFIQSKFFEPLGIAGAVVEHDAAGNFRGGARVFMKPHDWIKVGQLFLNNGQWNGRQVIDSEWLDKMKQPSGTDSESKKYGYQIWLNHDVPNTDLFEGAVSFRGYRGQYVVVIPKKNMVVARFGAYGFSKSKNYAQETKDFLTKVDGMVKEFNL